MNGKAKLLLVLVALAAAFGSGWLVGHVQNRNKVSITGVWANQWIGSVTLLAKHGNGAELTTPGQIQLITGFGLNTQSLLLGRLYDHLTPAMQKQLRFYIPAARAIALAQQGPGAMQDRQGLLTFADCMQKVQSQGGSVRKCVKAHKSDAGVAHASPGGTHGLTVVSHAFPAGVSAAVLQ